MPDEPAIARPVRVALVGFGYWGPNYARVLNSLPEVELVAAAEPDDERRWRLTKQYPQVHAFTSVDEMLHRCHLDAAVVATPAGTHLEVGKKLLRAGVHLLIEKPLATTVAEAEELAATSEEAGRILMVGHTFLFNPAVRRIKQYIDSGELGRIFYIYCQRTGLGPIRNDVSALWDLAPHDLSMLHYWLGEEPHEVLSFGQDYLGQGREDVAFLMLRYPGDVMAKLHVSWLDPIKVRRVTIVGDRKMAVFDDVEADEKLKVYDRGASYQPVGDDYGQFVLSVRDGDILIPRLERAEPLREQVAHFIECLRSGQPPLCGADAGIASVRILEHAGRRIHRIS